MAWSSATATPSPSAASTSASRSAPSPAVLGPNGAGKTTAVRILTTLSEATEGTGDRRRVRRRPRSHRGPSPHRPGRPGRHRRPAPHRASRTSMMIGELHQLSRSEAKARATELLEQFDLADAGDRVTSGYSGGMRRRLDLAATLVARPEVLFLDEPTTGLDPRARNELWAVLETLVDDGTTILLTTQYLEEADRLADDILVVDHGLVIARGRRPQPQAPGGRRQRRRHHQRRVAHRRDRRRPRPGHRLAGGRRPTGPHRHGPHHARRGGPGGGGQRAGRPPTSRSRTSASASRRSTRSS